MLHRTLALAALLGFAAAPLAAQAEQAQPSETTITGQVIDLNCYTTKGASGQGHVQCAKACANAGVALAILGSDGNIYLPVSSQMGAAQNARLIPLAEQKVNVTGVTRTKNGLHTIEISSIEAASS